MLAPSPAGGGGVSGARLACSMAIEIRASRFTKCIRLIGFVETDINSIAPSLQFTALPFLQLPLRADGLLTVYAPANAFRLKCYFSNTRSIILQVQFIIFRYSVVYTGQRTAEIALLVVIIRPVDRTGITLDLWQAATQQHFGTLTYYHLGYSPRFLWRGGLPHSLCVASSRSCRKIGRALCPVFSYHIRYQVPGIMCVFMDVSYKMYLKVAV
ncbi:unnamed protein product [Laminaria digitata]